LRTTISKVDSKGRITIPIGLRAKLKLLEGSEVRMILNKNKLIVTPNSNKKVCETLVENSNSFLDKKRR